MPRRNRNARKCPKGVQNVDSAVWQYIDENPTPCSLMYAALGVRRFEPRVSSPKKKTRTRRSR